MVAYAQHLQRLCAGVSAMVAVLLLRIGVHACSAFTFLIAQW